MSLVADIPVRRLVVVVNGALGALLLMAGVLAPVLHGWTVTGPAERRFSQALDQIISAERAALKRHGKFVPFASVSGGPERALAATDARVLRTDLFAYRASPTASGGLILTAWTRPDAVVDSGTPPFSAVYELSPQGKILRQEHTSLHE